MLPKPSETVLRFLRTDAPNYNQCSVRATPEQIDLWRKSLSEHQRLEFKEAKNQYDYGELCEYCVALANEGGGHLILGVADRPPRPVVGTKACNNSVGMTEKLFGDLGFRVDIDEVNHPDGRVVVFHIPSSHEAPPTISAVST